MYDFKDKVVLVTGGAKGIGYAICKEVLKEGAKHVRILDVDEKAGLQLQEELKKRYGADKAKFIKCDVTNDDQLFGAFMNTKEEKAYLDVVVNSAGVTYEFDYAAIRKLININYIALVNGTLKAIEIMHKNKGGRGGTVINMSSIAGLMPVAPPLFSYSSTKSAVLLFTSCIGAESFYKDTGVRAITLCYGATDTTIFNTMVSFEGYCEQELDAIVANLPMQSVQSAVRETIEAYKKGNSGSVWLINNNKPAIDITPKLKKHHEEIAALLAD